ncbi:hypothetical protein K440DRAFT_307355 [Wilcoxina mikolae CBS 423.85]|nr:hypothetical protein K440DRAFT_307355 [Wilcoxina mikolae CBS 423.85]
MQQSSLPPSPSYPTPKPYPVPGYPFVDVEQNGGVKTFLETQLLTKELDELSPWLFLVSTPKYWHISSLHEQIIRGREIVITEHARLHLLWYRDRIFIKPLPSYLLDDMFQQEHINGNRDLKRALAGFLRSYTYLIQGPADLDVANDMKLLPRDWEKPEREKKCFEFLKKYRSLGERDASPRYQYGDLRLSRINFWNRIFRLELYYQKIFTNYSTYFGRFMEPFLFLFGTTSVVLSAMQLVLAAAGNGLTHPWDLFSDIAKWFSIGSILAVIAVLAGLCTIFLLLVFREARYALMKVIKKRWNKRKNSPA